MTTTTDAVDQIRKELERVKRRHQHRRSMTPIGPPQGYCSRCPSPWPCDAARLAGVVETLVTALEFQRDYLSDCASDAHDNNIYGFSGGRDRVETALADAARELEES